MPTWEPSASTRRTSRARIFSLNRGSWSGGAMALLSYASGNASLVDRPVRGQACTKSSRIAAATRAHLPLHLEVGFPWSGGGDVPTWSARLSGGLAQADFSIWEAS